MKKWLSRAYLLFALSLFGLAGLHTIYLGKPLKGILFLIATWAGLFALTTVLILPSPTIPLVLGLLALPIVAVWWFVDLCTLSRQIHKANTNTGHVKTLESCMILGTHFNTPPDVYSVSQGKQKRL